MINFLSPKAPRMYPLLGDTTLSCGPFSISLPALKIEGTGTKASVQANPQIVSHR
jgi:hypothetical protein